MIFSFVDSGDCIDRRLEVGFHRIEPLPTSAHLPAPPATLTMNMAKLQPLRTKQPIDIDSQRRQQAAIKQSNCAVLVEPGFAAARDAQQRKVWCPSIYKLSQRAMQSAS
jgi:hypothetical protein